MKLGADIAEGCAHDEAMIPWLDMAHICCGAHAGSRAEMEVAVRACVRQGVAICAHPGYPDRAHFGRSPMVLGPAELRHQLEAQFAVLDEVVRAEGGAIVALKPHGALYHDMVRDGRTLQALRDFLGSVGGLPLVFPAAFVARAGDLEVLAEAFADRAYCGDGSLLPRSEPGAVLCDAEAILAQAGALPCAAELLCVHGDTPGIAAVLPRLRAQLDAR